MEIDTKGWEILFFFEKPTLIIINLGDWWMILTDIYSTVFMVYIFLKCQNLELV